MIRIVLRFAFSSLLLFLVSLGWAQIVPNTNIFYTPANAFVGIGTSSPLSRLHVIGQISATTADPLLAGFVQLWADNALIFKSGNVNGGLRIGSASDLSAVNFSEKMRIADNGNVGIGTTTPHTKLEVTGGVNAMGFTIINNPGFNDNVLRSTFGANTFDLVGTYNGWDPAGVFVAGYNYAAGGSASSAAKRVYIGNPTNGTNFVCVDFEHNNMGIGTTSVGTNKLAVEGTIAARKVIVTMAVPFPDYVFDEKYSLRPLDSVSSYIRTNHHLPEMPSADSVAKNGLDLGDNQAQLLKKIEELTLYAIQQQQQIETQNKEIKELRTEMKKLKKDKK